MDRVRGNHATELYAKAEPDLFIAPAHDMKLYERAKATAEIAG